jgi:hypothetical protein
MPAGPDILRRFRGIRESKYFRKSYVPVQDTILGGEAGDGRLGSSGYALWSQVQPAPGVVGDGWQCLRRFRPEKRRTPGIREQTYRRCYRHRISLGCGKRQGHLPKTFVLVTLPECCSNSFVVAGYGCKGCVRYALSQQCRGRPQETVAALDMVVEAR